MRNAGREEAQAGIKIARRNINNLRYADDLPPKAAFHEHFNSSQVKLKTTESFHTLSHPHVKKAELPLEMAFLEALM